jgi:hypothetical protein
MVIYVHAVVDRLVVLWENILRKNLFRFIMYVKRLRRK